MSMIEQLLTATMAPDRAAGAAGTDEGWSRIERAVERRRRRQRAALVVTVVSLGLGALTVALRAGGPIGPDQGAADGGGPGLGLFSVGLVGVATALSLIVIARRGPRRAVDLGWEWSRGFFLPVAIGLALPMWAYVGYLGEVGEVADQLQSLTRSALPGSEAVAADRTWNPAHRAREPVATATVTVATIPGRSAREVVEARLVGTGFEPVDGEFRRAGATADEPWLAIEVIADPGGDDRVTLGGRRLFSGSRQYIPLATWAASWILPLAAVAVLGSARTRRACGAVVVALTAAQAVLAIRALASARKLINIYRAEVGPLSTDDLAATFPEPAVVELRRAVENVATDLYPAGSGALLLLLIPWLLGSYLLLDHRPRYAAMLMGLGLVVTVAVMGAFGSNNGVLLYILE